MVIKHMEQSISELPIIGKGLPWNVIERKLCRVIEFNPFGSIKNQKVRKPTNKLFPYASIKVECEQLSPKVLILITQRIDFIHLWESFNGEKKAQEVEVLIDWSSKHKSILGKIFSPFLPKLSIMVCPKGSFNKITSPDWKSRKDGEAAFKEIEPLVIWERDHNKFLS